MWPLAAIEAAAPAKVNLTLHVTGKRDDGYHLLDSLVVFADISDQLTASIASDLQLCVTGPFAHGVPTDDTNLVIKAAQALREIHGIDQGAVITLEKNLPHAAGIGSGSSDAAAALRLLAQLWNVPTPPANAPKVLALGADVPICLNGPNPARMSGIGETISPVPAIPKCALVLVRPSVAIPTKDVFAGLQTTNGTAMSHLSNGLDFDGLAEWLHMQRNDLLDPAKKIAAEISDVIAKLNKMPAVAYAGMSGSGATCFGLVRDIGTARQVARVIQLSGQSLWVAPASIL